MTKQIGIYCITNVVNGKSYVGQSVDIYRRFGRHKNPKRNNHHAIGLAIHKYGVENFVFAVIELCNRDLLNDRESHWVAELGTMSPYGYNLNSGGGAAMYVSDETREKMVKAWRTRAPVSEETKAKISKAGLGKSHSIASREKIGNSNRGRASAVKGVERSVITKAKISAARMGHTHSEETRKKLSAAQKGRPAYNRMAILRSDGVIFKSMQDAANKSGMCRAAVGKQIKGEIKMAKGFMFSVIKPATISSVSDA